MILRLVWPVWALVLVLTPLVGVVLAGWLAARRSGDPGAWPRRGAMVLATVVIGLAPAVPAETRTVETNAEVFFVVDRTGSMAAEDHDGARPRLDGVREDVAALVEALPAARYSIIGFDSQAARQLPLTTDARAVRTWTQTLRQEITDYSAGSSLDRPLPALTEALEGAAERNPANVRLVFLLTDGENTEGAPPTAAAGYEALAPLVDAGAVLGYGTAQGGRMRSYDGTGTTGAGTDAPFILDHTRPGSPPAVSRIDEDNLRRLAAALDVPYTHRVSPGGLAELVAGVDVEELAADGRRDISTYRDVTWPVALVLAGLLAWEAYVLAARWRRLRPAVAP